MEGKLVVRGGGGGGGGLDMDTPSRFMERKPG